jgi:AcrR family transcriptional regulator
MEMVESILQAAAEIFAKYGYARATTNRIAERAGVSIGSLYQYFPNKDCLFVHLLRGHRAELHAVVEAALARLADPATPIDDAVRWLLREVVKLHETNPPLTAALSAAVLGESPSAREARKDEDGVSQVRLMSSVLAGRADARRGDHDVMAAVLNQAASQLTRWLVHDAPPELDRRTLLDETVQLLVRYLRE